MNAINLDDEQEREEFLNNCKERNVNWFQKFGDSGKLLVIYAKIAEAAAHSRYVGEITLAIGLENKMQSIYARLPDELRW